MTPEPIYAFPVCANGHNTVNQGMELRDYFAAKALVGLLQSAKADNANLLPELYKTVAKMSYEIADALLAERQKAAPSTS